jgi:POT family proton-dependent oligopeptide transporter
LSNASGYALAGTLGSILPATGDKFKKAKELGIDLQAVLDKKITPSAEQLKLLSENQISATNPVFAGFEIHNLYEFFMVFVILTGLAAIILFALTPKLKKLMHGVK